MKEFIDKLISGLEGREKYYHECALNEIMENGHTLDAEGFLGKEDAYCDAISIIIELAKEYKVSEMPTGWIPLGKQKPEYGQYVLANIPPQKTVNGGHPVVIMEFREDNEPLFYRFVSAWMPLPAHYTEGE